MLKGYLESGQAQEIVSDPYEAAQLVQRLGDLSVPLVEYPQMIPNLSPALKEMGAPVIDGRVDHPPICGFSPFCGHTPKRGRTCHTGPLPRRRKSLGW